MFSPRVALSVLLFSSIASSLTVTQVAKLAATGVSEGYAIYGDSVAIDGDTVVVGAPGVGAPSSAYVFVKPATGWQDMAQTAQLVPSDAASLNEFGAAVAVSGDVIAVSDGQYNDFQGKIYVYVKPAGGWSGVLTETAQLTGTNTGGGAYLGESLAMDSQGTIFAGVPGANPNGSIFVFVPPATGWQTATQTAVLTTSHGFLLYLAAHTLIAVDGTVVAEASGWPNGEYGPLWGAGFMWVKPATGWANASEETARFNAANPRRQDLLSDGIGFDGDNLILGAPGRDEERGIAFAYAEPSTGWATTEDYAASFTASNLQPKYSLGNTASLTPTFALISIDGYGLGKYLYEGAVAFYPPPPYTGVIEPQAIITDPAQQRLASFGQVNAAQGNIAVVTAYDEKPVGGVYVFEVK
jgi:hypothetical protein